MARAGGIVKRMELKLQEEERKGEREKGNRGTKEKGKQRARGEERQE